MYHCLNVYSHLVLHRKLARERWLEIQVVRLPSLGSSEADLETKVQVQDVCLGGKETLGERGSETAEEAGGVALGSPE